MPETTPIILFDAQCVFCSANARFILKHDRKQRFRLAAMQGATGAALFRRYGIDPTDPDTILVVNGDHVLRDSDAIIAIYVGLGWPWCLSRIASLIPRTWRDRVYRSIARNRYRLFGRRPICWMPCPEHKARVLP
jgi:predicted DCC family thiol-disulfide oxidoreductase YuxK